MLLFIQIGASLNIYLALDISKHNNVACQEKFGPAIVKRTYPIFITQASLLFGRAKVLNRKQSKIIL